ncbi:uncharacterized protein LOC144747021 [Ciona intestinalis]
MDDRDVKNNRDVTSTYTIMTPTTETADSPSFPPLKPNINVRYSRFAGDLHVTEQNNRMFRSSSMTQQSTKTMECPYLEMRTEIYEKPNKQECLYDVIIPENPKRK